MPLDILAGIAKSLLSGHETEINAIASLIEDRGTISGYKAIWAMKEARRPQAEVELMSLHGDRRKFVTRVREDGRCFVPNMAGLNSY